MSEKAHQDVAYRRRRVQRLKRLIILTLITAILIPYVLCAFLWVRLRKLDKKLDALDVKLSKLTEQVALQRAEAVALSPPKEGAEVLKPPEEPLEEDVQGSEQETAQEPSQEPIGEPPEEPPEDLSDKHKVYLTFDDGPSPNTDDILEILDSHGVKATFFVVGREDEYSQEMMKRIVEEGHTLGMHSYSHVYKDIYRSVEDFAADFQKLRQYLYDVTGVECTHYRFPGGSSNKVSSLDMKNFAKYLEEQGVMFHDWNVSSGDAASKLQTVDTLVYNCTKDITSRGTAVVLMHDSAAKSTTLEALPIIIEKIQAMEDTVFLPISMDMTPVQHIHVD